MTWLLMTAERIAAIEARLDAATRGPWQRSRFVDGPQYRGRSAAWKADADRRERESVIRGPGVVGTPDCNVVLVFARVTPEDLDLIAHAPQDLRALLVERERLLALLESTHAKAAEAKGARDLTLRWAARWREAAGRFRREQDESMEPARRCGTCVNFWNVDRKRFNDGYCQLQRTATDPAVGIVSQTDSACERWHADICTCASRAQESDHSPMEVP